MKNMMYKVKSGKKIAFWCSYLCAMLSVGFCYKKFPGFSDNLFLNLGICVLVGFILGILATIFVKDTYLCILDDGIEIIKGNDVTKYDFKEFVGTNVVKHYVNGVIPSGTSREIKFKKAYQDEVRITINNLSAKKFSELVALLGKCQFEKTTNAEITNSFQKKASFFIPSESIIAAVKRKLIFFTYIIILCLILSTTGFTLYCFNEIETDISLVLCCLGITGFIVFMILEIVPWFNAYRNIITIPNVVVLDNNSLTIDEKVFQIDDITKISMVPASYKILTRDLIVTGKDGTEHKYNFGKFHRNEQFTYQKYDELYRTVRFWCLSKNVDYMSILG